MINENIIPMPSLKPVRISTHGLPWWKKTVKYFERRKWEVTEDYILFVPHLDRTLLIPKGFIFDGASVPRLLWPIINPTGVLLIGSLVHDFGYRYNCLLDENRNIIFDREKDQRKFFDEQIRDINIYVNGASFMNKAAWAALRAFGWAPWLVYRRANSIVSHVFDVISKEQILNGYQGII